MSDNRDYEIPIRMLEPMTFDAATGQPLDPGEVGGLVREERLLPALTADATFPTLVCTLHFSPAVAQLDGLAIARMVVAVARTLSDAEKDLGGTGLEPRDSDPATTPGALTLRFAPTTRPGAAERIRALAGRGPELTLLVQRSFPAVARVEIAA